MRVPLRLPRRRKSCRSIHLLNRVSHRSWVCSRLIIRLITIRRTTSVAASSFWRTFIRPCKNSPYRDKILLVITFDEHGGCYDHVPPPTGAAAPDPWPKSRDGTFDFSRFGVRVPTILVSSYLQPGTVFRAPPGQTPFDHTSILATLRDWLNLDADPKNPFLTSPRIKSAPTLDAVLTLDDTNKNTNWPDITATCTIGDDDKSLQTPLNGLQHSLIAGAIRQNSDNPTDPATVTQSTVQAKSLQTYERRPQLHAPGCSVIQPTI